MRHLSLVAAALLGGCSAGVDTAQITNNLEAAAEPPPSSQTAEVPGLRPDRPNLRMICFAFHALTEAQYRRMRAPLEELEAVYRRRGIRLQMHPSAGLRPDRIVQPCLPGPSGTPGADGVLLIESPAGGTLRFRRGEEEWTATYQGDGPARWMDDYLRAKIGERRPPL